MIDQTKSKSLLYNEMKKRVALCLFSMFVGLVFCYFLFVSDYTSVSEDYLIVNVLNGRNVRSVTFYAPEKIVSNFPEPEHIPTTPEYHYQNILPQEPVNDVPKPLPTDNTVILESYENLTNRVKKDQVESKKEIHIIMPTIQLPAVGQTILCSNEDERKNLADCPVYWASSPQFLTDQRKYITSSFGLTGGIGNMIWRFASLYGIGRILRREVYFDGRNGDQMSKIPELAEVFPLMHEKLHIKFPVDKEIHVAATYANDCCKYDDPKKLKKIPSQYIRVGGDYLQSYKFFHEYRDEIRQLLKCGHRVMDRIKITANIIFGNDTKDGHMLCAHVRRGDFLKDLMLESKKDFVEPAIEYAHDYLKSQGHNDISLFFIGTDLKFIHELDIYNLVILILFFFNFLYFSSFSKIYDPALLPRGDDMCLAINYCDSMIMTASGSTYGWWISYLMPDNATIFYDSQVTDYSSFTKDIHDYDIFLENWIKLTVRNGTAHTEKWWWYQRHNWSREKADATCKN